MSGCIWYWQKRYGFTVGQKEAFVLAYLGGAWGKLLAELGPLSWKSLENWKLQHSREGSVLALADKRGIAHKGRSQLTERHTVIILGQYLNPNKPNVAQCYRRIKERCKAEELWIPSEPTIRRFVKDFAAECYSEYIFWREHGLHRLRVPARLHHARQVPARGLHRQRQSLPRRVF